MQAIGEFHQDHPDILGHRKGHFLEVFCLSFSPGLEHAFEFTDSVNQFSDLVIKLQPKGVFGDSGVFNHVMKQRCHQALVIHVHVCKDVSDG